MADQPLQPLGRALRRGGGAAGGRQRAARLRRALAAALALLATTAPPAAAAAAPDTLAAGGLRVLFWPGHRPRAERTLQAAQAPLPLPGLPPAARFATTTIVLAPGPALWDSLTGGAIPEWSAGVAIPAARTIVLPAFASPHTRGTDPGFTLRHELAHLALHAHLPEGIPRWFDEGYATWVSGEWDEGAGWQLRLAFLLGRAPPLDSLALGWPRDESDARLAYLLSASAVRHLAELGRGGAFAHLLQSWRREGSLDRAIRASYGMTLGQFEKDWRAMVRRRYGWLLMLSQVGVFWGIFAVALIWLWWRRRQRDRERLDALRAEERMLPAVASADGLDLPPEPEWEEPEPRPPSRVDEPPAAR